MVLSNEEIQSINRCMLGLGAPIERDNAGYNKPDYSKMECVGRYIGELDCAVLESVLNILKKYRKRQLSRYETDIEESLAYYKKLSEGMSEAEKTASYADVHRAKRDKYIPLEMTVGEKNIVNSLARDGRVYKALLFKFPHFIDFDDFRKKHQSRVPVHYEAQYKGIVVMPEQVESFVGYIRNIDKYGYALTADSEKWLEEHLPELVLYNEKLMQPNKSVMDITEDKTGVLFYVDGYVAEFQRMKSKYRELRSVAKAGKWYSYATFSLLEEVSDMLERNGYDTGNLLPYVEKARQFNQIEEEKRDNTSGNVLVPLDSLSLPFKPYPFQIEDAKEILSHKRMLIAHEMGCGKTFIAILVGESIRQSGNFDHEGRILVVVPESLRINWKREILQVNPNADVRIIYSSDKEPLVAGDWTIVGYATLVKRERELENLKFDCIFIDEAHKCKAVDSYGEGDSARAKAARNMCEKAKYVYPMTGTPIATSNKDVYNILKMVCSPDIVYHTRWDFGEFGKKYCDGQHNGVGWDFSGNSNGDELREILEKVMVRRLKKDVLPLLAKQRIFIPTITESREYQDLLKEVNGNGNYLGFAMKGRRILSKEKVVVAIDMASTILEQGMPVVIVSEFNESIASIKAAFGEDCCVIKGGMSDTDKQTAIDDFQSGKKHVCALNMIAGGVGITLTRASNMVICDYDWTPSNMSQVEDRINRAGQTESCVIYYVYCENAVLDTVFKEMITEKSANIDRVVDDMDNTMDFMSVKPVSYLEALKMAMERSDEPKERK